MRGGLRQMAPGTTGEVDRDEIARTSALRSRCNAWYREQLAAGRTPTAAEVTAFMLLEAQEAET